MNITLNMSTIKIDSTPSVYIYLRVSTKGQTGHSIQLEAIKNSPLFKNISSLGFEVIYDEGTAFGEDYESREIFNIMKNKDITIFVFDESRLSRNLGGAGKIIELIQRNRIAIYVVGVENPYVCTIRENVQRLRDGMEAARAESMMKSERSEAMARARRLIKANQPYQPPPSSPNLLTLLSMMWKGSNIQTFIDAFNLVTPWGQTEDKLGGNFLLLNRYGKEFTVLKKGDFTLKDILAMFNKWDVFQQGKRCWTYDSLRELVQFHFGDEAVSDLTSNATDAPSSDDDDDMVSDEIVSSSAFSTFKSHDFRVNGSVIFCNKCGRTNIQTMTGNSVVPCEF
jgi:hypothetical protein